MYEGSYGTIALVNLLTFFYFGTEQEGGLLLKRLPCTVKYLHAHRAGPDGRLPRGQGGGGGGQQTRTLPAHVRRI